MQIIIDGYNLLHNVPRYALAARQDLEQARESLLADLAFYGRKHKHKITVVFDGWQGGQTRESQQTVQGVSVIYSRLGEKADEVIRRLAQAANRELVMVTSDRGIIQTSKAKEIVVMSVEEFQLRLLSLGEEKPEEPEWENDAATTKKGNPRRLPKAQRKKLKLREKI